MSQDALLRMRPDSCGVIVPKILSRERRKTHL
jgi:hypothetical protein